MEDFVNKMINARVSLYHCGGCLVMTDVKVGGPVSMLWFGLVKGTLMITMKLLLKIKSSTQLDLPS